MNLNNIVFEESGERIDALLSQYIPGLSRNAAQHLCDGGFVTLSGRAVKKNYKVCPGDMFSVQLPEVRDPVPQAEEIPLDVRYEDEFLIVINKPRGLVVHPAPGHESGTLVNALLSHCGASLSGIGGERRPGIVHRIDKDTSGLLVVAKCDFSHQELSRQLSDHTLHREYEAVVCGSLKQDSGTIDRPVGRSAGDRKKMSVRAPRSRNAVTHYEVLSRYRSYTHIRCVLETGRTHQIRVHMSSLGHPLLGDYTYGAPSPDKGLEGQCLHARKLMFIHPASKEPMTIETELPDYFQQVLSRLGPPLDS